MKKNDLIKMLQNIKGNPEIILWNSSVGDYNKIKKIHKTHLYKECRSFVTDIIFCEMKKENPTLSNEEIRSKITKEEIDECMKNRDWEFANHFYNQEKMKWVYGKNKRTVVLVEPKKRNIETFDRLGKIKY